MANSFSFKRFIKNGLDMLTRAREIQRDEGTIELLNKSTRKLIRYTRLLKQLHPEYNFVSMNTPAGVIGFKTRRFWMRLDEIKGGAVYEPLLLNLLYDELYEDDVMYNVGARWGIISLFASECGVPDQNIHNFEADAMSFKILMKNVGSRMRSTPSYVGESDDDSQITLDKYSKNHDEPTVIKIDVEGAEASVIKGATDLLSSVKPVLYIEMHPRYIREKGSNQGQIINILEEHGYEITVYLQHRSKNAPGISIEEVTLPEKGDYLMQAV